MKIYLYFISNGGNNEYRRQGEDDVNVFQHRQNL